MDEASDDQWRNITDIADTTTLKILQQIITALYDQMPSMKLSQFLIQSVSPNSSAPTIQISSNVPIICMYACMYACMHACMYVRMYMLYMLYIYIYIVYIV